nr:cytochrome P450 76A1-like [Ipomoea trifida]
MEYWDGRYVIMLSAVFLIPAALLLLLSRNKSRSGRLPPGPPGLPVLGNMFDLGSLPHQTIAAMRNTYGPVVWLRIGSVSTLAIQSAKAAAELFKNHDVPFVGRNIVDVLLSHDYNKGSLVFAQYGSYWRVLRRICSVEMFVHKKVNETAAVRRKCVDDLLRWVENEAAAGSGIHVTRFAFLATFNMLGNLMFSSDLVDPVSEKGSKFFNAMMGVMEWGGTPNISDIFPCLRWLDLQGLRGKTDRDLKIALQIVSTFVKERCKEGLQDSGKRKSDFLDVLLRFEGNGKDEPAKLSEHQINIFMLKWAGASGYKVTRT